MAEKPRSPNPNTWILTQAVGIQVIIFSLMISINSFAKAETNTNLSSDAPEWLQLASQIEDEKHSAIQLDNAKPTSRRRWAFAFDNDFLVPGHRDQDYTYGINLTQTSESNADSHVGLNNLLTSIDKWIGNNQMTLSQQEVISREIGAFGFTPEDIIVATSNPDDRPYASLVYTSNTREQIDLVRNVAWKSTLTVGALGLDVVGELQNQVHKAVAGQQAEGWDNQISDGGEPTVRYVLARQQYFDQLSDKVEIKSTTQGSLGYLTEASWGLSLRAGQIHSPWASFTPELASYGERSSYSSNAKAVGERYFWAGFTLKARAYNAFLQGQFRNSPVTYEHSALRPLLLEAWAGYTFAFPNGYRISYVIRGHSTEIKYGAGNRSLVWGGLIFARSI